MLLGTMQGDLATVLEIAPAHNTFPTEEQFHRMGLATDFWTQVEDSADARGLQIVGFYHSHPDHPAQPSIYDLEHASGEYGVHHRFRPSGKARSYPQLATQARPLRF
ncbi:MAG UNVERIFIED_CONTAM: Mov34/MPN/PAD-1 family protein [Anaerolineae bacterium]